MFCFPRHLRLLTRRDYQRVLDQPDRKFTSDALVLFSKQRSDADFTDSRLGLIVSKKVGNAVVRNKVKRTVRESFRVKVSRPGTWDFVILARPKSGTIDSALLDQEIAKLWSKAGVMS